MRYITLFETYTNNYIANNHHTMSVQYVQHLESMKCKVGWSCHSMSVQWCDLLLYLLIDNNQTVYFNQSLGRGIVSSGPQHLKSLMYWKTRSYIDIHTAIAHIRNTTSHIQTYSFNIVTLLYKQVLFLLMENFFWNLQNRVFEKNGTVKNDNNICCPYPKFC